MKLYGAPVSPFVRKVLAFAAEKGLALELVPIGLGDQNPEFLACSPFRKMPGFTDGDFAISDSTAIVTYIDAKYTDSPLIPADAESRARVVWFDEFADTILTSAAGAMFYVVVEELIPEASSGQHSNLSTIGFAIGFVLMMVLDVVME